MKNVLILGSGGREHAIAWSVKKSIEVTGLFCMPGNAGTSTIAQNIKGNIDNNQEVLDNINKYKIDYTIIGPENPLENGIVDFLKENGCKVFGPSRYASQLETSKIFARKFMEKYEIPQPSFFECSTEEEVISISSKLGFPIVLKADGLAAGKGVIICNNQKDLDSALDVMFTNKKFGSAANTLSVEECLKGEELSIFVITDGENYKILNSAQDHKRIYDKDKGPNTGGMGAYCPAPLFTDSLKKQVENEIIIPTIKGMMQEGYPYKGFLYIGIMIVDGKPFVIEFNARLGDPEAQVLIPMLENSIFSIVKSVINSEVGSLNIESKEGFAVTIVLASEGYPEKYKSNMLISGLNNQSFLVFHSGTKFLDNNYYSSGGRVVNVVGQDANLEGAISKAYSNVDKISFKNMYFRKDIGKKGLAYLKGIKNE